VVYVNTWFSKALPSPEKIADLLSENDSCIIVGMSKFIFFTFILFYTTLAAATCEPINLQQDPQNPLNKMPIYDQDGDGSCYAYTASQMIDYYNLSKNPNHKLSNALWIAFAHKYRNRFIASNFWNRMTSPRRAFGISKPNELGFSDLNLALKDIENTGICDEEVVKSGIKKFKLTDKINDDEFLYLFNLVHHQIKELTKKDPYIEEIEKRRIFDIALNDLIEQREQDILNPQEKTATISTLNTLRMRPELVCSPTATPGPEAELLYSQLIGAFSFEKKNKQLDILRKEVFSDCFRKENISKPLMPKLNHVGDFFASNEKILENINVALDTKNAPAAIGYCSRLMSSPVFDPPVDFTPGVPPIPRVLRLAKSENVQKCSPHYSIVVGRRPLNGECQYLIRNTYGPHFWNTHMSCLCENDGKQFDCSFKTHGNQDVKVLGCWVPGENLAKSIFNVTTYK
jgi:hypothetical protein